MKLNLSFVLKSLGNIFLLIDTRPGGRVMFGYYHTTPHPLESPSDLPSRLKYITRYGIEIEAQSKCVVSTISEVVAQAPIIPITRNFE